MMNSILQIGVIGPGEGATEEDKALALDVGARLASFNALVICGGLSGVMASVCAGAHSVGGLTLGFLPGDREQANGDLDIVVPTGMGEMRNILLIRASEAVICIGGSWGTLSEFAAANRSQTPLVSLRPWRIETYDRGAPEGTNVAASSAGEAVDWAVAAARAARLS